MSIVLEVLICLVVAVAVIFFAGKKVGERQYLKTREEMKALELSFNQLLREMEMASDHNLKFMETKTNELKDLLPIIDKKALYVRDLLDEVEEKKKLPSTNPALTARPTELPPDPRMKREIEDLRLMVTNRLQGMANQLAYLAGAFHRIVRQLSDSLPTASDLEQIPRLQQEIARISIDCQRLNSFQKEFEQLAIALEPSPIETELIEASLPSSMTPMTPLTPLTAHVLSNSSLLKHTSGNDPLEQKGTIAFEMPFAEQHMATGSAAMEAGASAPAQASSSGPSLSPQQQSRSHEILLLVDQGITIPQIARRLCMVPGEVELIINIFGPRPAARKTIYR